VARGNFTHKREGWNESWVETVLLTDVRALIFYSLAHSLMLEVHGLPVLLEALDGQPPRIAWCVAFRV
jgi:hypothetical protein